jgi:hypothetical protein
MPEAASRRGGVTGHKEKRDTMNEVLLIIIIIAGWFVLNRFILPRFGVRT